MKSVTKWSTMVKTVPALQPTVERACEIAMEGVPGPVFVEVPVDLLYPEEIVRSWYEKEAGLGKAKGIGAKALELYIRGHLYRQFRAPALPEFHLPNLPNLKNEDSAIAKAAEAIANAERPVFVLGSQTLVGVRDPGRVARAIGMIGAPVYLAGTARGLLGRTHELQLRHNRGAALKEADVVIVCGFPFDFRLGYGRGISRQATLIAANLSSHEIKKNRRREIAVEMHAGEYLVALSERIGDGTPKQPWLESLRGKEAARDSEIAGKAAPKGELVDPIHFFLRLE